MTTRDKLISAAAQLIDEGGPAAVTLREVGRRAGVSHNAPYKHFTDKQDLLAAVAASELSTLADGMRSEAQQRSSGAAAVEASSVAYLAWAQQYPARFKLTFGPWSGEHEELGRAAELATLVLKDCVAAAHDEGTFRGDPERTYALIRALSHGAIDLELSGHLRKSATAPTPRELVSLLIQTLATPPVVEQ